MPSAKFRRLDQLLSSLGYCSRKEARFFLKDDRVVVDRVEFPKADGRYDPKWVKVDGESLDHSDGLFLLLNKPKGLVCSHADEEGPNIYSLFPERWLRRDPKLVSVGRLDKDTTGVLLVTDQHDWVQKLTSPKQKVSKTYIVSVDKTLDSTLVEIFQSGIHLKGEAKACLPSTLKIIDSKTAELELTEGKYHQVKRMFASCGYEVLDLHRSRFGEWTLGNLRPAEYKVVTF